MPIIKKYILKNHIFNKNAPKIAVTLTFFKKQVKLNYQLLGHLECYNFQKPIKQQRADELWKESCFELFLAHTSSEAYWEINLSPSTAWNAYRFDAYKKGMLPSSLFSTPRIKSLQTDNRYSFDVKMTLQESLLNNELQINLAVILLDKQKKRHFYTLQPRQGHPDFHDRTTFKTWEALGSMCLESSNALAVSKQSMVL